MPDTLRTNQNPASRDDLSLTMSVSRDQPETADSSEKRPVVVDLFSGAGGLSYGFESAGFDIVSAVEYDPVHAATHLFNFPLTDVLCRDIRFISANDILRSAERGWRSHNPTGAWDGVIDVLVGGPSCQGFSVMGKQDENDDRNQLISEFVRLVEEVRPRAFCMENVPGLLDSRFDDLRNDAMRRLRAAGYAITGENRVLNAEDFGVPQKRRRVFVVGVLGKTAPQVPAPTHSEAVTVAQAFAGLPEPSSRMVFIDEDTLSLSADETALLNSTSNEYLTAAGINQPFSSYGHARVIDQTHLTGSKLTKHGVASIQRFAATPQGTKETISRYYRLDETKAALTLRAGTGRERGSFSAARPLHPTESRVITVREAARLHSFPDWFRFHTTNWHGHRQIGNAVPPLLAAAAARSILAALGITPAVSTRGPIELGSVDLLSLSTSEAAQRLSAVTDELPAKRRRSSDEPSADDGEKAA